MINVDKNKINENINEAYNNQTERVKKLLESAKQSINSDSKSNETYTVDKKNVKQLYMIRKLVDSKKEEENSLLEELDVKFNTMNDKLDVNSKNLDFIFKNVAEKSDKEIEALKDVTKVQEENGKEIVENINATKEEIYKNSKFIIELKENLEEHLKNIQIEDILKVQQEVKSEIANSQNNIENAIKQSQDDLKNEVTISQNNLKNGIINAQNQAEKRIINNLETANINSEAKIVKMQKESENKILDSQIVIQRRIEEIQKENDTKLESLKQQLVKMYKQNDTNVVATFLEEKKEYIKELEEKDKQIRELNYKIYAYEEKLEKEISRRERFGIFSQFYRRNEIQEEQPIYACQILNAVY